MQLVTALSRSGRKFLIFAVVVLVSECHIVLHLKRHRTCIWNLIYTHLRFRLPHILILALALIRGQLRSRHIGDGRRRCGTFDDSFACRQDHRRVPTASFDGSRTLMVRFGH
jgi:hypothetical protein